MHALTQLQVHQLLRVLFLFYLVVFSFTFSVSITIFPPLVPAEILHNNIQARLNYLIKKFVQQLLGIP